MTIPTRSPADTPTPLHIDRTSGAGVRAATAEYSVSFGGSKNLVGTVHLATANGLDALTRVLAALGVPLPEIETAIRVLRGSPHHDIRGVTLARDALRRLGLPKSHPFP